ncbi:bacteriophage holin [Legionella oakridgensis]|uniref:Uncharacterized protein n=2 Tax=Legionella oakridgensis TaxID=29423 RepID=W0B9X0_9GAMM|nr:bacteriophage holin [Legionella oakridgensis]AHE66660.1 hypothetical protein Loa_01104 [Legionella oakridgensis ATCC 33761 = DSM 21215]ETO93625.1 hypothetical protein LOR_59c13840 [Legionella oakridgensis RV-2-2007]KTD37749.1 hypothetical protein Loak_1425 [Legionella oakridgensis]STY19799.1 Uncharacterised protein [Legionella longbeachae]
MTNCRWSPLALGLSLGIVWGISLFIMGLSAYFFAYGEIFVTSVGTLYVGYDATILGSIIGGIIGFIDAFIGGVIVAWLYNFFSNCCCKHKKK